MDKNNVKIKNFKTMVVMKVKEDQFNNDLKEELIKLGYDVKDCNMHYPFCPILVNAFGNIHKRKSCLGVIGSTDIGLLGDSYPYTEIEEYNPELYLALAAMTDGGSSEMGEYQVNSKGELYKITPELIFSCSDKKATIEELVEHLSLEKTPNKKFKVGDEFVGFKFPCKDMFDIYYNEDMDKVVGKSGIIQVVGFNSVDIKIEDDYWTYPINQKGILKYDKNNYKEKENTMSQSKKLDSFPYSMTHTDAKKIFEVACTTWRDKLGKEWGRDLLESSTVQITEGFYKKMREACSKEQHKVLDSIFGVEVADYPKSVSGINREYYINSYGRLSTSSGRGNQSINHVSTGQRARAFVALMQLVELRDAWNEIDGGKEFTLDKPNYIIYTTKNDIRVNRHTTIHKVLHFRKKETRDLFLETFKDLIETAKELL